MKHNAVYLYIFSDGPKYEDTMGCVEVYKMKYSKNIFLKKKKVSIFSIESCALYLALNITSR